MEALRVIAYPTRPPAPSASHLADAISRVGGRTAVMLAVDELDLEGGE
jgi:hypothetical protein